MFNQNKNDLEELLKLVTVSIIIIKVVLLIAKHFM